MFVHKAATQVCERALRKELQYLYARRVAVEALIRSLEEYQRTQKHQSPHRPRRTG